MPAPLRNSASRKRTISHDTWKAVFDRFPPKVGGALLHRVNRGIEDPNRIIVVAGFPTDEAAQAFASDPDLPEKMKEGGVVGAPRIETYEEVEAVEY